MEIQKPDFTFPSRDCSGGESTNCFDFYTSQYFNLGALQGITLTGNTIDLTTLESVNILSPDSINLTSPEVNINGTLHVNGLVYALNKNNITPV